jgi:hypothetical protein
MALFRRSRESAPVTATIHLPARLQPKHRRSVYEDDLDGVLAKRAPGSEVVGGGTEFTPETGPLSCDIEVRLTGDADETLALVIDFLEFAGAPVGSTATIEGRPPVAFGVTHGLSLSLDGQTLPDEVYAQNDVNELIGALTDELEGVATLQSWWEGGERTQLYFYGRDAARIRAVLESAAGRFPLAERSLVEAITD